MATIRVQLAFCHELIGCSSFPRCTDGVFRPFRSVWTCGCTTWPLLKRTQTPPTRKLRDASEREWWIAFLCLSLTIFYTSNCCVTFLNIIILGFPSFYKFNLCDGIETERGDYKKTLKKSLLNLQLYCLTTKTIVCRSLSDFSLFFFYPQCLRTLGACSGHRLPLRQAVGGLHQLGDGTAETGQRHCRLWSSPGHPHPAVLPALPEVRERAGEPSRCCVESLSKLFMGGSRHV